MAEAAAAGVIDFTQADPRSARWRTRLDWLLTAFRDGRTRQVVAAQRDVLLALVASGRDAEPERTARDVVAMGRRLAQLLLPWQDFTPPSPQDRADAWTRHHGSLDDPEVAAALERTIAWLDANNLRKQQALRS